MNDFQELKLGKSTPRHYPWKEAFRGRVWRSKWALYGKELLIFTVLAVLYGILLDEDFLWLFGLLLSVVGFIFTVMVGFMTNINRLQLVREGQWVDGELLELKDLRLWHEFFRGKAHRSFEVHYQYETLEGEKYKGSMVLCRCAYERLAKQKQKVPVVYLPRTPRKSLLLRVAVMRIPH